MTGLYVSAFQGKKTKDGRHLTKPYLSQRPFGYEMAAVHCSLTHLVSFTITSALFSAHSWAILISPSCMGRMVKHSIWFFSTSYVPTILEITNTCTNQIACIFCKTVIFAGHENPTRTKDAKMYAYAVQ